MSASLPAAIEQNLKQEILKSDLGKTMTRNAQTLTGAAWPKILLHKRSVVVSLLCASALSLPLAQAQQPRPPAGGPVKPAISDTLRMHVYADNWFVLYINGKLVAVDPINFLPHNVVSVDVLPQYPMTIAVMAKNNADPKTGMEYGDHIGDGGFIIKFSDGTVSNASWRAQNLFKGPLNSDI